MWCRLSLKITKPTEPGSIANDCASPRQILRRQTAEAGATLARDLQRDFGHVVGDHPVTARGQVFGFAASVGADVEHPVVHAGKRAFDQRDLLSIAGVVAHLGHDVGCQIPFAQPGDLSGLKLALLLRGDT
jgi:hypothetical protein